MASLSDEQGRVATAEPRQYGVSARPLSSTEKESSTKVAVIATHGMGQQVPFETIDAIAKGILKACQADPAPTVTVRTVKIGDQTLQRAEFFIKNVKGEQVEVHVYEGYWAPLTEGQTKLRDVLMFLLYGSFNGIINCFGRFRRYLFGNYYNFGPQGLRNRGWLFAALVAVVSVLILTTLAIIVTGGALLDQTPGNTTTAWPPAPLFAIYTNIVVIFIATTLLLLSPLGGLVALRHRVSRPSQNRWWERTCKVADRMLHLWIGAAAICALAVILFGVWQLLCPKTLPERWFGVPDLTMFLCWALLYGVAWEIRKFLIQYLGDVAAYVQPQILDRFLTIRLQIKKWVMDVTSAVYRARNSNGTYVYQGVLMIGHSLGSVIAYDTLNALLNQDVLARSVDGIADRTRALITFGSPLDKTAFIFGHRKKGTSETREAISATVQPLILNRRYREFDWINIYSKRDVISNELLYYDPPANLVPTGIQRVNNCEDPDARIPLAAHTEYWNNSAVFDAVYSKL